MIDAKSLRLGNWVNHKGEYRQVCSTDFPYIVVQQETENWQPIELTPELLIDKCGFEKINMNQWNDFKLDITDDGFYLKISLSHENKILSVLLCGNGGYDDGGQSELMQVVKYIHDVQNLFYDLTKTELNINLYNNNLWKMKLR